MAKAQRVFRVAFESLDKNSIIASIAIAVIAETLKHAIPLAEKILERWLKRLPSGHPLPPSFVAAKRKVATTKHIATLQAPVQTPRKTP